MGILPVSGTATLLLRIPVIFHASLEVLWISDVENGLVAEGPDGQLHTAQPPIKQLRYKKAASFLKTMRAVEPFCNCLFCFTASFLTLN